MKALIENGVVKQVAETDFPVSQSLEWVDIPEGQEAEYGYLWDGETFSAPSAPEPPPPTPLEILQVQVADLMDYAVGNKSQIDMQTKYSGLIKIKG